MNKDDTHDARRDGGSIEPGRAGAGTHRARWIVVGAGVAALVAVTAYFAFRPHTPNASPDQDDLFTKPQSRQEAHEAHNEIFAPIGGDIRKRVVKTEQRWLASAGFVEAPDAATRIDTALSRASAAVDDPAQLLSASDLDALMTTIRAHALARSEKSPDRYLALCEDESSLYEWIPIHENYDQVGKFIKYWGLEESPNESPQVALRAVWRYFLDEEGDRFDAVGVPPDGVRIVVRTVRTEKQGHQQFFFKNGTEEGYWTGTMMTTGAQQFRKPRRPIEEILKDRPGVVVAQCMIMVRMANGHPINWITSWMLDPQTRRWVSSWMAYRRARFTSLVF